MKKLITTVILLLIITNPIFCQQNQQKIKEENLNIQLCNSVKDTIKFSVLKNCNELSLLDQQDAKIESFNVVFQHNGDLREIVNKGNKMNDSTIEALKKNSYRSLKIYIENVVITKGSEKVDVGYRSFIIVK